MCFGGLHSQDEFQLLLSINQRNEKIMPLRIQGSFISELKLKFLVDTCDKVCTAANFCVRPKDDTCYCPGLNAYWCFTKQLQSREREILDARRRRQCIVSIAPGWRL